MEGRSKRSPQSQVSPTSSPSHKKPRVTSPSPSPISEEEGQKTQRKQSKVFLDPIHGPIEMHPLLVCIIDTPEFQRLRSIKQLGGVCYVYPAACHTRFEHSLGVAHLAGEFVERLRRTQEELNISDEDVLCVKIAGLCHDLGHGPFSHLFDQMFMPKVKETAKWKHEMGSVAMFNEMYKKRKNVKDAFEEYLKKEKETDPEIQEHLNFIKELINPHKDIWKKQAWEKDTVRYGRSKEKAFLYEIVANKRNGMDVDKWDYFARDCHHLGIGCTFDHRRHITFSRVIEVDGLRQICYRDKDVFNVYDMFYTRLLLHQRVCQHKTWMAISNMICDALVEANEHLNICTFLNSQGVIDVQAYSKLDDSILDRIRFSQNEDGKMEKARNIVKRIQERKLYKFIGESTSYETGKDVKKVSDAIEEHLLAKYRSLEAQVQELMTREEMKKHLRVDEVQFNYGSGDKNPVENMRFYQKSNENEAFQRPGEKASCMIPSRFQEYRVRVYFTKEDPEESLCTFILSGFEKWCKDTDLEVMMTPFKLSTRGDPDEKDKAKVKLEFPAAN